MEATRPAERAGGRPSSAPPCVALTGGIGSGKSAALAVFARCGAAVLSSDEVVHEVLRDAEVLHALSARFGAEIVRPDGSVDRARLGPLVFGDADGLAFLEGIIHPRVAARRREWVAGQDALTPRPALLVCEVPVLFEAGVEAEFDAVIVVTASDDVRRTRVEARGQSFVERQARQMPEHEKVARANRWFVNDGSLEDLGRWVAKCFGELAGRPCDN